MDQSGVAPTARELLERHLAEIDQPNQVTPEAAIAAEIGPDVPETYYRPGYVQGMGDYVSETGAARENNEMINKEYLQQERSAQEDLDQHIEKSSEPAVQPEQGQPISAREALLQHIENASREVTEPTMNPFDRDRSRQRSGYER